MPKLTPTFNDEKKLHIIPPSEPLSEENDFHVVPGAPLAIPAPPVSNIYVKPKVGAKKVAVIGTAPSSRMLAPYNDPSWEIWSCSPGNMNQIPKFDRWFELHVTLHWPENVHYGRPYLDWLKTLKCPVYAQPMYASPTGELPNATIYPKDEMVNEFGPYFFTSSFAWMIALAMTEGAEEIALFGVDMASRDEYILQRPGAYFFFLEAKRRGIKIGAPYESDILQPPPLYGFMDSTPFGRKLMAREKELKDRVGAMRRDRDSNTQSITYLEGALEDLDYIKNIWGGAQQF
jgi:hypothetical protein